MGVGSWPLWSTVAAILVESGMAVYFWQRRERFRGGEWFTVAIVAALLGAGCYLGQLLAGGRAAAVFWSQATGIVGLGALVGIFGFVAAYTHREWVLRSRWFGALAAALSVVFLVRFTNDLPGWPGVHRLWATGVTTSVQGGYRLVDVAPGPLWYVYTAVVTVTLLTIVAFAVEFILRPSQRLSRRRNAIVGLGVSLPALAAAGGQAVNAGFELSVPSVALSLVTIGVALARFDTLEGVPISRTGVVDEIDGGVVVFDDRERIVDLTTRAREILDAPAVTPGRELPTVLADRFEEFDPAGGDVAAELDDATYTVGGDRYVETRVSALTDRAGAELSRALLLYDVTERVERERELRRKNELLDEFASVVSHDVATPLGVIENKARLIEVTGETNHAEDIYDASERVQKLVDELRRLAQAGEEVGKTEPVELEEVTREAWESVAASRTDLTVADSKPIDADPVRLRQLLENLLENAVEHGSTSPRSQAPEDAVEHGSTSPDSQARQDAAEHGSAESDSQSPADALPAQSEEMTPRTDGDSAQIKTLSITVGTLPNGFYVADDGPGIPEDEREAIFEQGYTTADDGAGLGLAIVSRICDGHGWTIQVTESDDGGARFEIHTESQRVGS